MGFFVEVDTSEFKFQSKIATRLFRKKLEKVTNNPNVKQQLVQALAEQADPYVPYKKGWLSKNIRVSDEGIYYLQPYAVYQYYGEHYNHPADGPHPLARHHWIAYTVVHDKETLYAKWKEIIIRNMLKF